MGWVAVGGAGPEPFVTQKQETRGGVVWRGSGWREASAFITEMAHLR